MTTAESPSGPSTPALRLIQEISFLVLDLAGQLQDNHSAHAAALGLTPAQAKVIVALRPGEAVPMRVLADRLRVDPSNLTGLVDRLEDRDLVVRRPDTVDRRVKALLLTGAGERLRAAFWERLTGGAGPFGHLSADELGDLRDRLRGVLAPSHPATFQDSTPH
jgi:DNA-binding MarR family transcriptional regulator